MPPRKKHGWPFWIAVALIALPILYVGSFGPACWIGTRFDASQFPEWQDEPIQSTIVLVYRPLLLTALHYQISAKSLEWYAGAVAASNEGPLFDSNSGTFSWRGPGYSTNVIDRWR